MQNKLNVSLRSQFIASITMLENAIDTCPEPVWNLSKGLSDFWYLVYHTLFWLDFYMTPEPGDFIPPENIGLTEFDPEGILPPRILSKEELKTYLEHCMNKCREIIENLTEESAGKNYKFKSIDMPFFELLLYNMRHVQHHTAQLNFILRQEINSAPRWVKRGRAER